MRIEIIQADYSNPKHAKDLVALLDAYATDPMGGSEPLRQEAKDKLVSELSKRPYAFSILAYVDNKPAALANCFEAFSTFSCKPLVNIHDLAVLKEFRGNGLSQKLLDKVEEISKQKGCCKITLEVLSENEIAKAAYRKYGFSDYELSPSSGGALFWQKKL